MIPSTRPPNNTLAYCHVVLLHEVDCMKENIEKETDILHSIVTGLFSKTGKK